MQLIVAIYDVSGSFSDHENADAGSRRVKPKAVEPRNVSTWHETVIAVQPHMSVVGAEAENMCSARVFRLLTEPDNAPKFQPLRSHTTSCRGVCCDIA